MQGERFGISNRESFPVNGHLLTKYESFAVYGIILY